MDDTGRLTPVHPGEVLVEDFLAPLGLTGATVAVAVGMPEGMVDEIVQGKRGVTAGTALRLARFFGTSKLFWANLQDRYDLEVAKDVPDEMRPAGPSRLS
jgi:addiction module HigA family antidote